MSRLERLSRAFDDGPREAAALLLLVGVGLAGWSALVSVGRGNDLNAVVYLAVVVVLVVVAGALVAGSRAAEVAVAVALAASLPGIVGAAAELVVGVDAGKATEVRSLGVDPRLAVALNLAYFFLAAAIASWLGVRLRRAG